MAAHCSILAWRIPWIEEPRELQSIESHHRSCRLLLLVLKLSWASLTSYGSCPDKVRRICPPSQSLGTVQPVALLVMHSRKVALDSHICWATVYRVTKEWAQHRD